MQAATFTASAAAIRNNRVMVISGETGCGKSTVIPQLVCDAEGLVADDKVVICTQPRRISAVGLAERVSRERGDSGPGGTVGYSIRLESRQSEKPRLLFCTTGILLRRLVGDAEQGDAAPGEAGADAGEDRVLEGVSHIVVDEVHERSLQSDFLLVLLRLWMRRLGGKDRGSSQQPGRLLLLQRTLRLPRSCSPGATARTARKVSRPASPWKTALGQRQRCVNLEAAQKTVVAPPVVPSAR